MNESHLLRRTRQSFQTTQGIITYYQNKALVNFARNDYLGFSQHPKVKQAAVDAIQSYGTSSSASPLVTGYNNLAETLENTLAEHLNVDKVLLFSSGTSANYALMHHLSQNHSPIIADKLIHASLIDGILAHSKHLERFRHNNTAILENIIKKNIDKKHSANLISIKKNSSTKSLNHALYPHIVTESVFSMEGDSAPLSAIASLAHQYQCHLTVDESHALGVLGNQGRGLCHATHIKPHAMTSSLGKALASQGGFIAGSTNTIEELTQSARPLIYSTALAPSAIAAAQTALNLMRSTPCFLEQLHNNIAYFQEAARTQGLQVIQSNSAIQGFIIHDISTLIQAHQALWHQGFITGLIRPPTVPANTSRLRICLSALHSKDHIQGLVTAMKQAIESTQRA